MKILQWSLVLSLALIAASVWAEGQSARVESSHAIQAEAWQIVSQANQARAEVGAAPLKWDAALAAAARQHCLRMAAEGPISHQYAGEPDVAGRAAQVGARFSLIEENVAVSHDWAAIHEGWMNSPHHRANLLNPAVDHIGVAVVASRGRFYAVADYERAVPALTPEQIETTIAGLLQKRGVAIMQDSAAARAACRSESSIPVSKSGQQPRFVMRWQGADLSHLPRALGSKLASKEYHKAAVGSCSPQGQQDAFTAYRLAVLLY
jgi:hypothetical protein